MPVFLVNKQLYLSSMCLKQHIFRVWYTNAQIDRLSLLERTLFYIFETHHEKNCFAICEQQRRRSAYKGADQPAHPRSLISAFVVRCVDIMITMLAKTNFQDSSYIQLLQLSRPV